MTENCNFSVLWDCLVVVGESSQDSILKIVPDITRHHLIFIRAFIIEEGLI